MTTSEQKFIAEARPLAESLIDYAIKTGKAYGITDARISISSSEQEENAVEKGEVIRTVSGAGHQVTVMLYAGDKVMSFSKNSFDKAAIEAAMLDNMRVIHMVPGNKDKRLLDKDKVYHGPVADLDLYDAAQPTTQQLVDYARDVEAAAMSEKDIKGIRSVSLTRSDSHALILATNGLDLHESTTFYAASASIIAERQGEMQVDYEQSIAHHFSDMSKPQDLGKRAAQGALAKLGATLPQTGDMPIVLSPDAAESFFASVYRAISGTAVHRGLTFLKDKMDVQVMNASITIVDDPTIARARNSMTVDRAGVKAEPITFIKDGILKSFNVNLQESRQLGIDPIGRESGITNSRVLPGSVTPDALMADIKDGIYIQNWNGGSADVNNGIHSREAYGVLIKDGKITGIAVAGFVISGNLKDMFMNAVVANDTPALPNPQRSFAAPTTRIDGITIAGK